MMKQIVLILFVITIAIGCNNKHQDQTQKTFSIRIPAEFEPQNSIWMGFKTIESASYNDFDSTRIEIIKALNPYIKLNLVVEHDSLLKEGKDFFARMDLDTSKINIFYQSPTDIWYRDPGPIFGITKEDKLALADFKYTGYLNVLPDLIDKWAQDHEGIDRNVAERLNIPIVVSKVAMEGGAFETNGKGTLIQVENITLKRNPHLSKDEIEEDFLNNFGITNVIWLPAGVADDPHNFKPICENIFGFGTGGHTDEFVRFANDSTILLSWVSDAEKANHPINRLNHEILSENYLILKNSTNSDGNPFKIIKIPHPTPTTYKEVIDSSWQESYYGKELIETYRFNVNDTITMAHSSSYLNYIISDEVILLPEYWTDSQPLIIQEKDQVVRSIFEELYPDRVIIGINPLSLNTGGGGMHCCYQSEPRVN